MQNEKLMILKMLEERKITSEEAARLLQSVDAGTMPPPAPGGYAAPPTPPPAPGGYALPPAPGGYTPPPAQGGYPPPLPAASYGSRDPRSNNAGGAHRPSPRGAGALDDLGRRFESFAKRVEPKIKSFVGTIAEKIDSGTDSLSKTFSGDGASSGHRPYAPHPSQHSHAPRPAAPSPPPAPAAPPSGGLTEKNIEMRVDAGFNELALSGLNGDLRVKGYNGDKITARILYKAKRGGAEIDLMKLGGKYQLNYEPDDFERVVIDAYVPERAFSVIKIDGINTHCDISSLAANDLRVTNANGNVRLTGIAAANITAESSAGRFILSNIAADSAAFENVNGSVEADELDIAKLSLTNYNGPLSLLMSTFARHSDYLWSIETGNAKLNMNLPTLPDLGYHIKAHAAMGEIRLGLTGLQFLINDSTLAEARSTYFDSASKRVKMTVETSNAPLVIN